MREFIYKLFRLHYVPCHSCEHLAFVLNEEKRLNKTLLDRILYVPEVKNEIPEPQEPIKLPVRLQDLKRKLELEDRVKNENSLKVAELEKELELV